MSLSVLVTSPASFAFFHHIIVVIFSIPISYKSLMNERRKPVTIILFKAPKQNFAKCLSCSSSMCLPWSLFCFASFSFGNYPNYSWNFLIDEDLVVQTQLVVFWPEGNTYYIIWWFIFLSPPINIFFGFGF